MASIGFVTLSSGFRSTSPVQSSRRNACQLQTVPVYASQFVNASVGRSSLLAGNASHVLFAAAAAATQTFPHSRRPMISMKKDVVVVTGASSGLGLEAAKKLAQSGDYMVIMAVRSYSKAELAMKQAKLNSENYKIMYLDLASFASVREFVANLRDFLKKNNLDLFSVVNNAATWHPKDKEPRFTADGFEEHVGTNHLGHFLLSHLLVDDLKTSSRTGLNPRVIFLGTETHNPNSPAGKVPPRADLGNLAGLMRGLNSRETCMIDGKKFEPTKAYKDSKVCNAITMKQMSDRYAYKGITVSIMFPGCVASSGLFREKRAWFNSFFP
jgi:protochlorophyllide reductase